MDTIDYMECFHFQESKFLSFMLMQILHSSGLWSSPCHWTCDMRGEMSGNEGRVDVTFVVYQSPIWKRKNMRFDLLRSPIEYCWQGVYYSPWSYLSYLFNWVYKISYAAIPPVQKDLSICTSILQLWTPPRVHKKNLEIVNYYLEALIEALMGFECWNLSSVLSLAAMRTN